MGEDILPTYVKALQLTRELIQQTSGWMEQHPKIAKFLTISAASLGVFLIVMGGLGIALAAVLGPIAMFRFALGFLGLKGFGLISILRGLWTALRVVFFAVRGLGLMLLANPIALTIMGIAVAALLIYKYWEPIKGMWDKWLVQPLSRAMEWVANLPSKFMTIGGQIIDGLWNGISAKWEALKTKVAEIGNQCTNSG